MILRKQRRTPKTGFHFYYMIDLLEMLQQEQRASYIYLHSKMSYKKTLLKMIAWLEHKSFISVQRYYSKGHAHSVLEASYKITHKGRTLLDFLE